MDRIVHRHVRLRCDVAQAFHQFTDNAQLEAWLTVKADIEPAVGGKYELFWEPDTPEDNSTLGCKVTAIAHNQMIAFEWRGPVYFKPFMNNADPLTHIVVSFAPCVDAGQMCTDVHLLHTGWRNTPEWEQARQSFVQSWDMAFDKLEQLINQPAE